MCVYERGGGGMLNGGRKPATYVVNRFRSPMNRRTTYVYVYTVIVYIVRNLKLLREDCRVGIVPTLHLFASVCPF